MSLGGASVGSIGGYALVDLIGKGGMGEVWRAERTTAGSVRRRAAVKRILPQFQRDPMLRERFIAEARITARLEHPNIVQLLDFGDTPELYLVLEYIDGTSVSELLKRSARTQTALPLPAVLYIIAEAATGLDYAHRRTDDTGAPLGIVHRDVSPANMLVSTAGAVKVSDFGVARAADNIFRTAAGIAVGKVVYMAPEQARGEAIDRRADIFALGVCLWELLVLRPLIPRGSPAEALSALQTCNFPSVSSLVQGLPVGVDEVVHRALARDASERTSTGTDLAKSLRMLLARVAPGFSGNDLAGVVWRLVPEVAAAGLADPLSHPGVSSPNGQTRAAVTPAMATSGSVPTTNPPAMLRQPPLQAPSPLGLQPSYGSPPWANVPPGMGSAPAFAPQPTRQLSTAMRVAIAVGVITIAALAVTVVLLLQSRDDTAARTTASAAGTPAATGGPSDGLTNYVRDAFVQAVQTSARTCVGLIGMPNGHGAAHMDFTVTASGTLSDGHIRTEGLGGTYDDAMTNCLNPILTYGHVPSLGREVRFNDIVVRF